jgi:uncharacterized membrane protein YadS
MLLVVLVLSSTILLARFTGVLVSSGKNNRKRSTSCPLCTLSPAVGFAGMFLYTAVQTTFAEDIESMFGLHIPDSLLVYVGQISSMLIAGALVGLCIDGLWINHAQGQGEEE